MRTTIDAGTMVYNAATYEWKPAEKTIRCNPTMIKTTGRTQDVWFRNAGTDFCFIRVLAQA